MRTILSALSSILSLSATAPAAAQADGLPSEHIVRRSPRVAGAEAQREAASASVDRLLFSFVPRLDLGARVAHLDGFPDGRLSTPLDPAIVEATRTRIASVADPAARGLFLAQLTAQEAQSNMTIRIPRDQLGFTARLTVPVTELAFVLPASLEAARARVAAESARVEVVSAEVRLQSTEVALRMAEAHELVRLAERTLARAGERLRMAEAHLERGVATPVELDLARAAQARATESMVRARGAITTWQAAWENLAGVDAPAPTLDLDASSAPLAEVDTLVNEALSHRAELEAMHSVATSLQHAANAADAQALPRLALHAGAEVMNPSSRVIPPRDEFVPAWEVGATLGWSPSEFLSSLASRRELDAQAARTLAERDGFEQQIRLEVTQAHAAFVSAQASIEATRASVTYAERVHTSRLRQVAAGEATQEDLDDAQLRLEEAELAVLRARFERALARARLDRAVGRESP